MADNDKARIRYDDFVSNVQRDPAKPESTIMLSGFVGHGPEGHARVYPDPTLGTWYDIPEGDVVYSTPIADSKLGGSYIWVRASSEIKPGSAAPAATPALEAQQQPHAAAAMMPTPATHCFICPPHAPVAAAQVGGGGGAPTPATLCIACPLTVERGCVFTPPQTMCCPPTPMTNCHPFCLTPPPPPSPLFTPCCPPTPATNCIICDVAPTPLTRCFPCPPPVHDLPTQQPTLCCPPHTQPVGLCGVVPQSGILCSQACMNVLQAAAPAGGGFTAATVCTMPPGCLPPGFTLPVFCGVLPPSFGCTQQGCAPGAAGAPPVQAGAFEGATVVCSQPARCTQACMPQAQHGGGVTAATVCTMPPGCPTHTVHAFCPPNTINTPCATFVCPTLGACPTVVACTPNGVFTPFGR